MNKTKQLDITLEQVVKKYRPGPNRIMVQIMPQEERSIIIEIPEKYRDMAEIELRACKIIKKGERINMKLELDNIAIVIYRPTQKLWETLMTSDNYAIAFLPEEVFTGVLWTSLS